MRMPGRTEPTFAWRNMGQAATRIKGQNKTGHDVSCPTGNDSLRHKTLSADFYFCGPAYRRQAASTARTFILVGCKYSPHPLQGGFGGFGFLQVGLVSFVG